MSTFCLPFFPACKIKDFGNAASDKVSGALRGKRTSQQNERQQETVFLSIYKKTL